MVFEGNRMVKHNADNGIDAPALSFSLQVSCRLRFLAANQNSKEFFLCR